MQWVGVQAGIGELRVLPNLPRNTLPPKGRSISVWLLQVQGGNSKFIRGVQGGAEMET